MTTHARGRFRTATLASATLVLSGTLALSLVTAAEATPTGTPLSTPLSTTATASVTTTPTAPATTVTGTPATTALTPAQRKAARIKARKKARAAHERRVRDKVVRIARNKLRSAQYVAGAAGPNRFDCSGFALYVWRKAAGRNLPHYSGAQAAATKNVSRENIKRGDLVFFMNGGHHVGIYIGHGKMIGATNPASDIKVDRVWSGWYGQRYSGAGKLFR